MDIPLVFYKLTITIKRNIKTREEEYRQYLQQKRIAELEQKRLQQEAQLPPYCTRF